MGKLTDKVARGVFWVLLEKFGIQAAHFVVTLVLARLLTPNDYGTVALISAFITVANVLVHCGLGSALVQKKDASQTDFNTVFFLSMAFAATLYTALFFAAPFIARFYGIPELKAMLRVLAFVLVFHSLNGVQGVELKRKMLFKLAFKISWVKNGLTYVTGVSLAYAGYGPWALIWATMAGEMAGAIARQLVIRWRPTATFSWSSAKTLFSFGWKMVLGSLVSKLYGSLNSLVVGKCFLKSDLAFVSKGNHVAGILMNTVDSTISKVAFPALAKMQDAPERLRRAMRRMIKSSTFFVFPLMATLAVLAEPVIALLFGPKWMPAVPYLRLACFSCAVKPFSTVNVQAIVARGHSGVFLSLVVINRIIGIIAMVISYRWGVYAFIATGVFSLGIGRLFVNTYPNWHYLGYTLGMQLMDVLPAAAISGLAAGAAYFAGVSFAATSWLRILVGCPLAAMVYMAFALFFRFSALGDIAGTIRPTFAKRLPAILPAIDFMRKRCGK